jgi:hypothetical protein
MSLFYAVLLVLEVVPAQTDISFSLGTFLGESDLWVAEGYFKLAL